MYNYLQAIAIHGMRGKKRSMAYMFLVLLLSMTFVVVNVSISGSLKKTGEQLRYDTYGDWDIALFHSRDISNDQIWKDERILDIGTARIYGSLLDGTGTPVTCLGSPDDKLWELGHLAMESGRFPREANEIAVEADVLSRLGYDYQLGQTITLRLWDQRRNQDGWIDEESVITREYVLCGVLQEYTDLWVSEWGKLAGAFLSPEGAAELGRPVSYQHFLKAEDGDPMTAARLYRLLDKDYEALQSVAGPVEETAEQYHFFHLAFILFTTIVAVIAIYSIQLKEQKRSVQLFRIIGATKRQISVMIFFETIWILVPAAIGGLGAGSLATWGLLQILMKRNLSTFYISIPFGIISGMAVVWLLAVFLTRLVIFCYAMRGKLLGGKTPERRWLGKGGGWKWGRRLGLALLSAALVLTGIFCYLEALIPIQNDDYWAKTASYSINAGMKKLISEEYLERIRSIPGVEGLVARVQWRRALEFPGIEDNAFCRQLAEDPGISQPFLITGDRYGTGVPFPKGVGSNVFAYSEDNWELLFEHTDREVDRDEFAAGEAVILYLPYNVDGGIERGGKVYREFGVEPGDEVTLTTYGRGELKEDGEDAGLKNGEDVRVEYYEYPREISQVRVKVAGIITEDLTMLEPKIVVSGYYTVLSSRAFAERLKTGEDGIELEMNEWTNEEFGYERMDVYTGMDAGFLSTDYVVAQAAVREGMELDNRREQNASYRQEAQQTLIQLWVSGMCIFLVTLLVLLNLETILGISHRKSYALWRIIGMSKGRLRLRLLGEGGLLSLSACLLGHVGYLLFWLVRNVLHYRRLLEEFDDMDPFGAWLLKSFRGNLEMVNPLMHLAVCILCMLCVFLLFYCSQNRALKGNIRDQMQ